MRDSGNDILDSKIRIHDKNHFEIKLDVNLPDESSKSGYQIESYFFIPKSLNIGPNTYSKDDFYRGVQKYVRFKTPRIALDRIADPAVENSPYNRILKSLHELTAGANADALTSEVYREFKLLGSIVRASLRDMTKLLLDQLDEACIAPAELQQSRFIRSLEAYLGQLPALSESMRGLFLKVDVPVVPQKLRDACRYLDEFYSVMVEDYLSALLFAMREKEAIRPLLLEQQTRIAALLTREQDHRRAMGYPSIYNAQSNNSVIPYRRGVLKKFFGGVLYLNLENSEWEAVTQLNFAVAAGVAMLFAAVVTLFAQTRFSANSSMFITIVVVSYMLKDRLKDWMKGFLARRTVRWISDRKVKIRDPHSGRVIGYFREAVNFIDYEKVPHEVRRRRNMDNITSIDEDGKPERVLRYIKEVVLLPGMISRFHQRQRDINDIMRFDVSEWARNSDDPVVGHLHYDRAGDRIASVECSKVYHLNIIFKYQTADTNGGGRKMKDAYERVRLILDRNGISNLMEVSI